MGWQRRKNALYYYHTVYLENGSGVNIYCGKGARGLLFEQFFARMAEGRERLRLAKEESGRLADEALKAQGKQTPRQKRWAEDQARHRAKLKTEGRSQAPRKKSAH
jgi:hypothetical protein